MTINFLGETTRRVRCGFGGRLLSVGNRSFRSVYAVFRDDRLASVYFDRRSRGSTTSPPEVRQTIEAELQDYFRDPTGRPAR